MSEDQMIERRKPCICHKEVDIALLDHNFKALLDKMDKQSTQLDIIIGKLPGMEIKIDGTSAEINELSQDLDKLKHSHYEYRDKFNYWFARGLTLWGVLVFAGTVGAWAINKWIDKSERDSEKASEQSKFNQREEKQWKEKVQFQIDSIQNQIDRRR